MYRRENGYDVKWKGTKKTTLSYTESAKWISVVPHAYIYVTAPKFIVVNPQPHISDAKALLALINKD